VFNHVLEKGGNHVFPHVLEKREKLLRKERNIRRALCDCKSRDYYDKYEEKNAPQLVLVVYYGLINVWIIFGRVILMSKTKEGRKKLGELFHR